MERRRAKECSGLARRIARPTLFASFKKGTPVIFPGRNYRLLMKAQPMMPRRVVAAQVEQAARKMRSTKSRAA